MYMIVIMEMLLCYIPATFADKLLSACFRIFCGFCKVDRRKKEEREGERERGWDETSAVSESLCLCGERTHRGEWS